MPGSDELERLLAVEGDAARMTYIEARRRVDKAISEVQVQTSERIHDILERLEIDLDEVVDRDAEVLFDCCDELIRAVDQGRVDPVGEIA